MNPTTFSRTAVLLSCLGSFILAGLLCPLIGPTPIDWGGLLSPSVDQALDSQILFHLRLPRVAMALVTGAALAAAGVAFQSLLRNPLADPFTLGIAGGSSLGAVTLLLFFPLLAAHLGAVTLAAFLGALASIALVVGLARLFNSRGSNPRPLHPMALLLSGLTVNYFFSALLLVSYAFVDFTRSASVLRWILGGLDAVDNMQVLAAGIPVGLGLLFLMAFSPSLNLLSAGEDLARSKGLDIKRTHLLVFLLGSLLTASVTAFTGPIGFVGLMVPNLLRRSMGYDHRWLLPASVFLGGAFLAVADTIARTVFAPAELPVGALTALLGGPLFLLILLQTKHLSTR